MRPRGSLAHFSCSVMYCFFLIFLHRKLWGLRRASRSNLISSHEWGITGKTLGRAFLLNSEKLFSGHWSVFLWLEWKMCIREQWWETGQMGTDYRRHWKPGWGTKQQRQLGHKWIGNQPQSQKNWVQIPPLIHISYVTLERSHNLSMIKATL